jgi:hypothetical protein
MTRPRTGQRKLDDAPVAEGCAAFSSAAASVAGVARRAVSTGAAAGREATTVGRAATAGTGAGAAARATGAAARATGTAARATGAASGAGGAPRVIGTVGVSEAVRTRSCPGIVNFWPILIPAIGCRLLARAMSLRVLPYLRAMPKSVSPEATTWTPACCGAGAAATRGATG